jgi:hypothetical protein
VLESWEERDTCDVGKGSRDKYRSTLHDGGGDAFAEAGGGGLLVERFSAPSFIHILTPKIHETGKELVRIGQFNMMHASSGQ